MAAAARALLQLQLEHCASGLSSAAAGTHQQQAVRQGASKATAAKTSERSGARCTQLFQQALQQAMPLLLTQRGICPQRVGNVLGVEVASAPRHSMICQGLQELGPRVVVHLGKCPHHIGSVACGEALAVLSCRAVGAAGSRQAAQVAWTCWPWELGASLGRRTLSAGTQAAGMQGWLWPRSCM